MRGMGGEKVPGVLVHCMQGYNRSVAICVAWLLRKTKQSLEEIVTSISLQRPFVLSNRSFLRELILYDDELNGIHQNEDIGDSSGSRKFFSIGEIVERI